MYNAKITAKCRVVKTVTDRETFRCLKPATIVLIRHTPEPIVMCSDCARELAKEIVDSVPGGKCDVGDRKVRAA